MMWVQGFGFNSLAQPTNKTVSKNKRLKPRKVVTFNRWLGCLAASGFTGSTSDQLRPWKLKGMSWGNIGISPMDPEPSG